MHDDSSDTPFVIHDFGAMAAIVGHPVLWLIQGRTGQWMVRKAMPVVGSDPLDLAACPTEKAARAALRLFADAHTAGKPKEEE